VPGVAAGVVLEEMSSASVSRGSLPPGPRLPPVIQAILRIWRYQQFREQCYARYGDTFTLHFGGLPQSVLTRDRGAIRRLFSGDPLSLRHGNDILRTGLGDGSLMMLEPAQHLRRRKLVSPPFHGKRVRSYARLSEDLVAQELDRVAPGEVLVVQPFAQALTLEVILRAALGISDASVRKRLHEIFDVLTTPRNSLALLLPTLTRRARWNLLSRPVWRLMDELDELLLGHIAATRADPSLAQRQDILAMLVSARDERGEGLSDAELRDELATLITAGHETTATAIAWGVELLAHNPAVAERARSEAAYLEATVKEVLRLYPPLPVGAARHPLEPFAIGRWTIPPEVLILADAAGVHHDPEVYRQPNVFRPERFIDEPPDSVSFLPFGGGAHRCLGAALAMLELQTVLGATLERLELAPVASELARPVARAVTIAPGGGGRVLVLRKRPHAFAPSAHAKAAHE